MTSFIIAVSGGNELFSQMYLSSMIILLRDMDQTGAHVCLFSQICTKTTRRRLVYDSIFHYERQINALLNMINYSIVARIL